MLALRATRRRLIVPVVLALGCATDPPLGTVSQAMQCVSDGTILGMDVSSVNGTINWSMVSAGGIQFAYMKATQATDYTDPDFATNWAGAHTAGVVRGAYHFFDPTVDGAMQAQHFLSVMGPLADGDLPPMLDIECPTGDSSCLGYAGGSGDATGSAIRTGMLAWITAVQAATGRVPVIYTFTDYFTGADVDTTGLATYPLFIANINGTACFTPPAPWTTAAIWQYTWNGTVPGISGDVDLDRFMGTMADLTTFTSGTAPAWGAQYVTQSWPLSEAGHIALSPGQHMTVSIEERNIGTATWDSNTRFATTDPRNRVSALAGPDWIAPDRPATVTGTVAPGGTYTFTFTLVAPMTAGTYDEHFGFVEEGTAWFGDPGQGGPADDVIEMIVDVSGAPVDAGPETDAGDDADTDTDTDAGVELVDVEQTTDAVSAQDVQGTDVRTTDAGEARDGTVVRETDAGTRGDVLDAGTPADDGATAGGPITGGCGCVASGAHGSAPSAIGMIFAVVGMARRRRRRASQ